MGQCPGPLVNRYANHDADQSANHYADLYVNHIWITIQIT